jgi:hypothetical protein
MKPFNNLRSDLNWYYSGACLRYETVVQEMFGQGLGSIYGSGFGRLSFSNTTLYEYFDVVWGFRRELPTGIIHAE